MKQIHFLFAVALAMVSCSKKNQHAAIDGDEAKKATDLATELHQMEQQEERLRREIELERLAMEREELRIQREALAEKGRRLSDEELAVEKQKTALAQEQADAAAAKALTASTPSVEKPIATQGSVSAPASLISASALGDYDYSIFYERLSSQGTWFQSPDYGYVWRPSVCLTNRDWRPYTYGSWAFTNYGWTWVSTEPFGWATYHYGRWILLRNSGWCWVPGNEWAPAWVCWKSGGDYVGWAPLPPESLYWRGNDWTSYYGNSAGISPRCFSFVRVGSFGGSMISAVFSTSDCVRIYQQTNYCGGYRWDNRRVYCEGVSYDWVNRHASHPLPRYDCDFNNRPPTHLDPLRYAARRGDRLTINAPNFNVPWNGALRPRAVESKPLQDEVIRNSTFEPKLRDRFITERRNENERAEESMRGGLAKKMSARMVLQEQISRQREDLAMVLEEMQPEKQEKPLVDSGEIDNDAEAANPPLIANTPEENPVDEESQRDLSSVTPALTNDPILDEETAEVAQETTSSELTLPMAEVDMNSEQGSSGSDETRPILPRETVQSEESTTGLRRQQEQAANIDRRPQEARDEAQRVAESVKPERPIDQGSTSEGAAKEENTAVMEAIANERKLIEAQQLAQEAELREQQKQQIMREVQEQEDLQTQEADRIAQEQRQEEVMRAAQDTARQEQMREQQEAALLAEERLRREEQETMRQAQQQAQQEQMQRQQEASREAQEQAQQEQMRQQQEAMREAQERAQQEQMRQQQEAMREAQQEQMQRQQQESQRPPQ